MNIFSFGVHFTDEKSCRMYFKEERDKIDVKEQNTTGFKINGTMNVSLAGQDNLCAVVLSWRIQNSPL